MTQCHSVIVRSLDVSAKILPKHSSKTTGTRVSEHPCTLRAERCVYSSGELGKEPELETAHLGIDAAVTFEPIDVDASILTQSSVCGCFGLVSDSKPAFGYDYCACPARRLAACLLDRKDKRACYRAKPGNVRYSTAKHRGDAHLLAQLHHNLRQLSPQRRKELIVEKLTQEQRLALEQWMLQHGTQGFRMVASAKCCGHWRKTHPCRHSTLQRSIISSHGYRICLSLNYNFYVQSGLCKDAQEGALVWRMLMGLQKRCHQASSQGQSLKACLVSSINALRQSSRACAREAVGLRFRTQISFGRGHRLSSPLRRDPVKAFEDWQRLTTAWNCSLFSGSQLRSEYSPDLAEKQWLHSCRVWRDIWIHRGRCPRELERSLKAKEAALGPRWAQAKARWHQLQAKILAKINRLLAMWPRPRSDVSLKGTKQLRSSVPFYGISTRGKKRGIACSPTIEHDVAHLQHSIKAARSSKPTPAPCLQSVSAKISRN